MDIWPTVHAERKALAADLRGRSDEDWAKPSLCGSWTVRDVLAHMTSAAKLTPPAFFGKMIGSGFSFDKVQEKGVAAQRGATPADTLANFESVVNSVKHPPGPNQTWLGEVIVHSEDIRRALAIRHQYPTDAVVTVADFYTGLQPADRLQAPHFRAHAARHRHRVDARHRARAVGSHLVPGHGHDRTQGGHRRPDRRGRGNAAVALLTRSSVRRTMAVPCCTHGSPSGPGFAWLLARRYAQRPVLCLSQPTEVRDHSRSGGAPALAGPSFTGIVRLGRQPVTLEGQLVPDG